jgi:hypothetical protein
VISDFAPRLGDSFHDPRRPLDPLPDQEERGSVTSGRQKVQHPGRDGFRGPIVERQGHGL